MITSRITYLGELRTSSQHLRSGSEVISDAPVDNHGKGEAFSPTDLLANSLGSCMITIMGLKAAGLGVDITGMTADITKHMQAEPRMVSKIEVVLNMNIQADEKTQTILERAAMTCPVYLSLHPDIEKVVNFNWLPANV